MFDILNRKRTPAQRVVNAPLVMHVGGFSGKKTVKTIELREPNLELLGKHLTLIAGGLTDFLSKNHEMLASLMTDPSKLSAKQSIEFGAIPTASLALIAELVGEDVDWVLKEMSGQQTVVVLERYLDLIGWDLITKTFTQAWQNWNAALDMTAKMTPTPLRSAGR
jgi:hypothetical protein